MNKINIEFPLLFDGAMGTYYPQKSKKPLPECEMANLFDAQTVLDIHKEYGGVVPEDAAFGLGGVVVVALVDEGGELAQNGEAVGESAGDEELAAVGG